MDSITVEIPKTLIPPTEAFVSKGMFPSSKDVVIAALSEFIRHYQPELVEQFAHEDIKWAKQLRKDEKKSRS